MILSLFSAIALAVAAFSYPPLMACLYILCSANETAGVGGALGIGPLPYALGPLCFISTLISFGKIWRERNTDRSTRRIALLAAVALVGSCWVALAAYALTGNFRTVFFSLFNSGMYGLVIALAYRRARPAQIMFGALLIAQLLLCLLVTVFNSGWMKIFDAARYIGALEGTDYTTGFGISGENIYRISGQFSNPVQLAFYGSIGILVGGWLLATQRLFGRIAGGVILALAAWVTYYTIERAILLGLVVALFVFLYRVPVAPRRKWVWVSRSVTAIVVIGCILYLLPPQLLRLPTSVLTIATFFSQLGSSSEYAYRVEAFTASVNLIGDHPLFGMGTFDNMFGELGVMPHQAMLAWSAISGIPAGICCTLLLWLGLAATFATRRQIVAAWASPFTGLSLMFGWVVLAMAISNGMSAGMFGWVCLGIAALAWAELPVVDAPVAVQSQPLTAVSRVGAAR